MRPQRQRIADLIHEGQVSIAITLLEELAGRAGSRNKDDARWARRQLRRLREADVNARQSRSSESRDDQQAHEPTPERQRIIQWMHDGQYPAAVRELEALSQTPGKRYRTDADWARRELRRVRELPEKMRRDLPSLVRTAQKLFDHHDYQASAELLVQVPAPYRTDDAKRLLNEAIEVQEEVDMLSLSIEEALGSRQILGIEDNVRRMVRLKPGDTRYRKLLEALTSYSKYPSCDRPYRFTDDHQL